MSVFATYLLLNDTSLFTQRYNKVGIYVTDSVPVDSLSGEVYLPYTGFYDYTIYGCTYPESYEKAEDFVSTIVGTLEIGLMWLIPSTTTSDIYEPDNTDTIIYQNV